MIVVVSCSRCGLINMSLIPEEPDKKHHIALECDNCNNNILSFYPDSLLTDGVNSK